MTFGYPRALGSGGTPITTRILDNVAGNGNFSGPVSVTNWNAPYVSTGGKVTITASASGISTSGAPNIITLTLSIDSIVVKTSPFLCNSVGVHSTFQTLIFDIPTLSAGSHTISLTITGNGTADSNDFATIIVSEWPTGGSSAYTELASTTTATTSISTLLSQSITTTTGTFIDVNWSASGFKFSGAASTVVFQLFLDGSPLNGTTESTQNGFGFSATQIKRLPVTSGTHTIDLKWYCDGGTATINPAGLPGPPAGNYQEHAALHLQEGPVNAGSSVGIDGKIMGSSSITSTHTVSGNTFIDVPELSVTFTASSTQVYAIVTIGAQETAGASNTVYLKLVSDHGTVPHNNTCATINNGWGCNVTSDTVISGLNIGDVVTVKAQWACDPGATFTIDPSQVFASGNITIWGTDDFGRVGAVVSNTVDAFESTSSFNTYIDLTTVGPSVTIDVPTSGNILVTMSTAISTTGGTNEGSMALSATGANTITPGSGWPAAGNGPVIKAGVQSSPGGFISWGPARTFMLTGLNPGSTTFTAKYSVVGGGSAGVTYTFGHRDLTVDTRGL